MSPWISLSIKHQAFPRNHTTDLPSSNQERHILSLSELPRHHSLTLPRDLLRQTCSMKKEDARSAYLPTEISIVILVQVKHAPNPRVVRVDDSLISSHPPHPSTHRILRIAPRVRTLPDPPHRISLLCMPAPPSRAAHCCPGRLIC